MKLRNVPPVHAEVHDKLNLPMLSVRRRLSWLVCAWLTCQIATVVAAPITFCCKAVPVADDDEECCPGVAPGQLCPMHHKTATGKNDCKMRSTCGPADAMLVALAGGIGVLPRATAVVNAFVPGDVVAPSAPVALARSSRPESPPPRA
jgi:hypothetical protein